MAKQKFLTSLILTILLGMPIGVLAERPVSRSTAAQGEIDETMVPNLFGIPSVGYVFEPDALALRPILGTPGAAVFGSRVELGMNVRRAWVSPRQNFALAEVDAVSRGRSRDLATCSTGGEDSFGSPDRSRPGCRKSDGHGNGLLLEAMTSSSDRFRVARLCRGRPWNQSL